MKLKSVYYYGLSLGLLRRISSNRIKNLSVNHLETVGDLDSLFNNKMFNCPGPSNFPSHTDLCVDSYSGRLICCILDHDYELRYYKENIRIYWVFLILSCLIFFDIFIQFSKYLAKNENLWISLKKFLSTIYFLIWEYCCCCIKGRRKRLPERNLVQRPYLKKADGQSRRQVTIVNNRFSVNELE